MKKFKKKVRRDASNIDLAFFKWILPRLECFLKYNVGYPAEFGSRKNFEDEIREKSNGFGNWLMRKTLCHWKNMMRWQKDLELGLVNIIVRYGFKNEENNKAGKNTLADLFKMW